MKKIRLLISFVLIFTFCMTLVPFTTEAATTTQGKAEALGKLSIMASSNNNFNLTATLKRSEATVFIVRLLGKMQEVTDTQKNYKNTGFTDVPSTSFYAPYIGYCTTMGYIAQVGNNKFQPDAVISEKAFITMLLRALGYKDGTDFSWANVYQIAYSFGIVTDVAYQTKTADKTNFTRGDMVEIIYTALYARFKASDNSLLANLIGSGVVTLDTVKAAGFVIDKLPTAVSSVVPTAYNKVSIKLNEDVQAVKPENILVYQTLDRTKTLACTVDSQNGSEILIGTGIQIPDVSYTIELSNLMDTENNTVDKISISFKGYKASSGDNSFFRVERAESVNKNTVNVYFTHPINANAEIPLYYEIYDGDQLFVKGSYQSMSINPLGGYNNGIAISLQNYSLVKDRVYVIKISGDLYSAYGAELNESKGDEAVFAGNDKDEPSFDVTSIKVTGPSTLAVEFNRFIDPYYGKQFLNYTLTGPNNTTIAVSNASLSSNNSSGSKLVQLTIQGQFDKTKQYTLNINFLPDLYKTSNLSEKAVQFNGYYDTQTDFNVVNCQAIDSQSIQIIFDRAVSVEKAETISNYSVSGITNLAYSSVPVKARYLGDSGVNGVKLYFAADKALESGKSYKVRVSKSIQGVIVPSSTSFLEYAIQGSSDIDIKPIVSDVDVVSKDTVRIVFNKDIAADVPNVLASNYSLEYKVDGITMKKTPLMVGYVNETTILLRFDRIDSGYIYKVSFNTIKGYAGVTGRTSSDGVNYVEFNYTKK